MALIKCKECNHEISKKASTCPNCGAKNKQNLGCLTLIFSFFVVSFLGLIILGLIGNSLNKNISSNNKSIENKEQDVIYNEGQNINIGYTSYFISKSWYSNKLSDNQFLNQKPNAIYLFVQLSVKNNDKEARNIPPFKLIDQNNAEYEPSSHGWAIEGHIDILQSLNPSVEKNGFLVFDVPKNKNYKLKISGGFWSSSNAFVNLKPKG